ncbi:MAG: glutaredoxin family protein [Candidatus Acidiferrales bacterium]
MTTLRMYFAPWCGDCRAAKRFLQERGVAYEGVNIEEFHGAAELIIEKNDGRRKVPTFELDGRWFSASPFDPAELASQLGLDSR